MKKQKIGVSDFENAWKTKLSSFVKNKIKNTPHLHYRKLTESERDEAIRKIVEFLLTDFVVFAGKHRYDQWEKGWGENLTEFKKTKNIAAIEPRYFGKYLINRFRQKFVMASHKKFEVGMLSILEYWIFDKYLRNFPTIYEFGCGTGHNLLRIREVNKGAVLWGLDWATSSQKLIRGMAPVLKDEKLKAHHFDYFHPDKNFKLDPKGAIFTFASLEQTGKKYKKFVDYILKNKPALCVHIEPTGETLDPNHLLDYLSIKYFQKRKYLDGFIAHLKALEKKKKVKVIKVQRSYIGSFYIDGYSIIVWKPL
jgi:hypothetical protein